MVSKRLIVGIVGLLIVLLVGGIFVVQQGTVFKPFKGDVVLPLTEFYECKAQFPIIKEKQFETQGGFFGEREREEVFCGRKDIQGYFPEGCDYTLSPFLEYDICSVDADDCGTRDFFGSSFEKNVNGIKINLKSNQKMVLEGNTDTSYSLKAIPYSLERTSPTQGKFIAPTKDQCRLIQSEILFQLEDDGRIIDFDKYELKPQDKPLNVVVGGISVTDPKNIIYHPNTGEVVYVKQFVDGIKVCETFVTDNQRFANLKKCSKDSSIFCLPSNPACSDSGNDIVENPGEDKSCSEITGIIDGYVPISATERCLIVCENGKTKINQDKCIDIPTTSTECPSDRPMLVGNKCVNPTEKENLDKNACANEGGIWVEKETNECGILCNIGLEKPTLISESFCKQSSVKPLIIFGLMALIFIILITSGAKKEGGD